jgi:hypothetical protein
MGRPADSPWRAYHLVLKGHAFGIVLLEPGFRMTRNSAKNHTQPELAIPVGDPSGKARRVSSGTVVCPQLHDSQCAEADSDETHPHHDLFRNEDACPESGGIICPTSQNDF